MKDKIKRLGILCIYDRDGMVDDYVLFLLKKIKIEISSLLIICNGKISCDGEIKLKQYADKIIIRENNGFDAWAWRYGLIECKYIEKVKDYDELVLFNDTFYGPFYPFEKVFKIMEKRNCDFWGLTIHSKANDALGLCKYGYIPEHIQSYFLVFNKKVACSKAFFDYWNNLQPINSFDEAVLYNEACLTKYFSDFGFSYDVLCDTRALDIDKKIVLNQYFWNAYLLLSKYNCPIIKKKTVMYGPDTKKCLKYISEKYNYDINMILKNSRRCTDKKQILYAQIEKLRIKIILALPTSVVKIVRNIKHRIFN